MQQLCEMNNEIAGFMFSVHFSKILVRTGGRRTDRNVHDSALRRLKSLTVIHLILRLHYLRHHSAYRALKFATRVKNDVIFLCKLASQ